jgi:tripartite-type tricarboxylate transporter receptor subunit TctC
MKILIAAVAALAFPLTGHAQTYPNRPITLIVPYTPGTGIDILARTVGQKIAERWGQSVVVDNKPGASGNIGAAAVAKAPPNGSTIMVAANTFTVTPALYPSLQYDPVKDFTPIVQVATGNLALVAHPSVAANNFEELAAAARAKEMTYASPGNGTPQHLAMELLKQRLKVEILHVPYKGSAQAVTDLLGGQVQLAALPVHTALPHAKAGRLKLIAVSGERRSLFAPDLPTFAELGLTNLDIDLYYFISGPARLPPEIVEKWNQEVTSILTLSDVSEALMKQGMLPAPTTAEVLSNVIASDIERWKKFVGESGIKAD